MALLEVSSLNRRFGGLQAVGDLSFNVEEGTIKSVIGPNGAGKTTLFNLLSGFLAPDSGSIRFHGKIISKEKPHQIAERGMSRTFQHIRLFPHMSALENVLMGRHMHTRAGFITGMLHLPWSRRESRTAGDKCREIMKLLDIESLAGAEATSLAYGQQRVVELARALACEPDLLLLDEPAAGLNMRETEEMSDRIAAIRERGVTVLIVEHDMSLVMGISDEILVLSYGRKIAEDNPRAIQKNSEVIRIYLGEEDDAQAS
jgi:branched-chain amino acid transport system ATP-binding protein